MADFLPAYERMLLNEGGYKLHNVAGDRGGVTYAGIARNKNPQWSGWDFIDRGEEPPATVVRAFYREGWWLPLGGDQINDQKVAEALFDFGVNSSAYGRPAVAAKLAQIVVGATPDGKIGSKTLAAINAFDPARFLDRFALAVLARYHAIGMKDKTQRKFWPGWFARGLRIAQ